jgi:hypothetical protein
MYKSDSFDRRTTIKGLSLGASSLLLQGLNHSLGAELLGKETAPRIIFFMESNGLYPHHIQPKEIDGVQKQFKDVLLDDYTLPEAISPLTPLKNKLTIIQKLSHKVSGGGDHGKGFGGLGCFQWRKGVAGQTIDHAIADQIDSIIPVLGLAVPPTINSVFLSSVSAISTKKPLSMIASPEVAYQSLFGSVADGMAKNIYKSKNNLLDWITEDVKRVRSSMPSMDHDKLDSYLSSFENMRKRQDRILQISDQLRNNNPNSTNFNKIKNTERFESQCDIAIAALAAGLTNVVTLDAAGGIGQYHTWKDLGIDIDGHAIGHQNGPDHLSIPIRKYHAERVVQLANKLDSIKENDGTMLDNTIIVWMSDSGEGHHGFCAEWPLVIVGNWKNRLKLGNRFLQYPSYETSGNRTIRNFYLALLHAIGNRTYQFGELDPNMSKTEQDGPLNEIIV